MLSVWPAGLPSNGEGTIEWAGGLVDWNSEYMQNGYYFALVKDVSVECYDPPSDVEQSGSKAYKFTDDSGLQDSVAIVDEDTTLASLKATGEDPDIDPEASKSAEAAAKSDEASADEDDEGEDDEPETEPESVPGLSGAGERSEQAATGQSGSDDGDDDSSGGPNGGSEDENEDGTEGTSFSQGSGSTDNDNEGESSNFAAKEQPVKGSVFAVVVAALGLLVL